MNNIKMTCKRFQISVFAIFVFASSCEQVNASIYTTRSVANKTVTLMKLPASVTAMPTSTINRSVNSAADTIGAFYYTNKSVVFGLKDSSIAPSITASTALTFTLDSIQFNDKLLVINTDYTLVAGMVSMKKGVTTGTLKYPVKTNLFKLKTDGSIVVEDWCAEGVYKLYVTASDGTTKKAAVFTATITAPEERIESITYNEKKITVTHGSHAFITYAFPMLAPISTFVSYYWIEKVTKDGIELFADAEHKRNALANEHRIWLDETLGSISLDGLSTIGKYVLSVRGGQGANSAVGDITVDLQSFAPEPTRIVYSPAIAFVPSGRKYTSDPATMTGAENAHFWLKEVKKDGIVIPFTSLDDHWTKFKTFINTDGVIHWASQGGPGTHNADTGTYVLTIAANMARTVTTTYTITVMPPATISYLKNYYTYSKGTSNETHSVAPTIQRPPMGIYSAWIKSIQKENQPIERYPAYEKYAISISGTSTNADFGMIYWGTGPAWKKFTPGTYVITVEMTGGQTTTYLLTKKE